MLSHLSKTPIHLSCFLHCPAVVSVISSPHERCFQPNQFWNVELLSEAELLPQLQVPPVFRWCFCRGSNACLSSILWLDSDWGLLWGTLCSFPRNTSRHLLQDVVFLAMGPCIWMLWSNHFTMWFWRSFAVGFLETMSWPSCQHVRC